VVVKHGNLTPNPLRRTLTPGEDAVPSPAKRARVIRYSRATPGKGDQKKMESCRPIPLTPFRWRVFGCSLQALERRTHAASFSHISEIADCLAERLVFEPSRPLIFSGVALGPDRAGALGCSLEANVLHSIPTSAHQKSRYLASRIASETNADAVGDDPAAPRPDFPPDWRKPLRTCCFLRLAARYPAASAATAFGTFRLQVVSLERFHSIADRAAAWISVQMQFLVETGVVPRRNTWWLGDSLGAINGAAVISGN
jgi:hypothetical protein